MNTQEALMVLRKVIAYQPNQRMDELTREAWAEALEPYDVRDALDAVKKLAVAPRVPGQPFWMEVRDIVQECRHVEQQRVDRHWSVWNSPPRELCDDFGAEVEWIKAKRREVASRDYVAPPAIERPDRDPKEVMAEIAARTKAARAKAEADALAIAHHDPATCPKCA